MAVCRSLKSIKSINRNPLEQCHTSLSTQSQESYGHADWEFSEVLSMMRSFIRYWNEHNSVNALATHGLAVAVLKVAISIGGQSMAAKGLLWLSIRALQILIGQADEESEAQILGRSVCTASCADTPLTSENAYGYIYIKEITLREPCLEVGIVINLVGSKYSHRRGHNFQGNGTDEVLQVCMMLYIQEVGGHVHDSAKDIGRPQSFRISWSLTA